MIFSCGKNFIGITVAFKHHDHRKLRLKTSIEQKRIVRHLNNKKCIAIRAKLRLKQLFRYEFDSLLIFNLLGGFPYFIFCYVPY